jgi:hypothetical protein
MSKDDPLLPLANATFQVIGFAVPAGNRNFMRTSGEGGGHTYRLPTILPMQHPSK